MLNPKENDRIIPHHDRRLHLHDLRADQPRKILTGALRPEHKNYEY